MAKTKQTYFVSGIIQIAVEATSAAQAVKVAERKADALCKPFKNGWTNVSLDNWSTDDIAGRDLDNTSEEQEDWLKK